MRGRGPGWLGAVSSRPMLRGLLTVLTCAAVAMAGFATPVGASGPAEPDSYNAVAYQLNPSHNTFYDDPNFGAPFPQAWSKTFAGTVGYPLIVDGRVFVAIRHEAARRVDVKALSLATGEVVWGPTSIGGSRQFGWLAYDDNRVFALNDNGLLTAFNASTGAIVWTTSLEGQTSFQSPPTAMDGVVYVLGGGVGGTLFAVDGATGNVEWAAHNPLGGEGSPAADTVGVYVSLACEQAYRFALSGDLVWHHDGPCSGGGGVTPVLYDDKVYARGFPRNRPDIILDRSSGTQSGTFEADFGPALNGVYMATVSDGVLTLADQASGTALWSTSGADYVTTPLITRDYVIAGRRNGSVEIFDMAGSLVWTGTAPSELSAAYEQNYSMLPGLVAGDGALVVPAGQTLTAFFSIENPTVAIRNGPPTRRSVGPSTSFSFWSADPTVGYECTLDGHSRPCTSPVRYQHLANGSHFWTVRHVGSTGGSASRAFNVDAVGPVVRLRPFKPLLSREPRARARWSAVDAASKVAAYQLRVRQTRLGTRPTEWSVRAQASRNTAVLTLRPRSRLCASVRAKDALGNWSAWSSSQCVRRLPKNR